MQTDRRSAFVVDCVKICLTSSSIVMQNSVVVSRTVCAHVGSTNNLGMLGAPPLSTYGRRAFAIAGPTTWNSLPTHLHHVENGTAAFGRLLKTHLFSEY